MGTNVKEKQKQLIIGLLPKMPPEKEDLGMMVIYNIGMSVENFMTRLLIYDGIFPEHSSISRMLREIKKIMPLPEEFMYGVWFMNSVMSFCSLEVVTEKVPTDDEIIRMVDFVTSL